MKVIIAGSRTIADYKMVLDAIEQSRFDITEVVCGMAMGPDLMGRLWAKTHKPPIPVKEFPADWKKHGKSAGYIRNAEMGDYADALIAVTNGSLGTKHMIEYSTKKKLKVFVYSVI